MRLIWSEDYHAFHSRFRDLHGENGLTSVTSHTPPIHASYPYILSNRKYVRMLVTFFLDNALPQKTNLVFILLSSVS